MKLLKSMGRAVCFIFFVLTFRPTSFLAQDIKVFKGAHFQGDSINMMIGDEFIIDPPIETVSFIKYNPAAALLVEALSPVPTDVENWSGTYDKMFYYSDEWKRSGIPGTDQYGKIPVRVKCIHKKLPEPDIYIPVDSANIHPESSPFPYPVGDKSMLYLKRAFFWENSEDLRCDLDLLGPYSPHGPTGDIKINVCHASAANYSLDSLDKFQQLWDIRKTNGCEVHLIYHLATGVQAISDCDSRLIDFRLGDFMDFFNFDYSTDFDTIIYLPQTLYHSTTAFGPVYVSPPACDLSYLFGTGYAPVAHNEWTDGPWGTYYSNIAVVDWDMVPGDEVALVISEADVPIPFISDNLADVMGVVKVKKSDTNDILVNLGTCGWIIVKNEVSDRRSVEYLKHYWYPTWNGNSPEVVIGPPGPVKHFEMDNYFCEEVGEKCAAFYNDLIANATVGSIYVNLSERDTFRTYFAGYAFPTYQDTFYSNSVVSDTLFWTHIENITLDTIYSIVTPGNLYRKWGSQYQPYYAYKQIERYVLDKSQIGVYGGIIPANNLLTKQMTLLPLDPELSKHKALFHEYSNANKTQNTLYRNEEKKIAKKLNYRLFPNPAEDQVFISAPGEIKGQVCVFNALGEIVLNIEISELKDVDDRMYSMNVAKLVPGIYFIKLDDQNTLMFVKK